MRVAVLLFLTCLFGVSSNADTTIIGLIYGEPQTSINEGGKFLSNVDVRFDLGATVITATTDSQGYYEANLPLGTGVEEQPVPPAGLFQNFPNPFNPTTVIPFSLAEPSAITLTVYNTLGQHVRTLAEGFHDQGYHTCVWDGRDDTGRAVSAGVYIYRLKTANSTVTSKMLLIDGGASSGGASSVPAVSHGAAKPAGSSERCIMTIETEGFLAWADTFTVYDNMQSRKDVIMIRKGGEIDLNPDFQFLDFNCVWGDDTGGDGHTAQFEFDIWEESRFSSVHIDLIKSLIIKEKGIVDVVPWSHANVDSVYITITESPKPERINLTIPMIFHFWTEMHPVVTNIDELSYGILDVEIMELQRMVVKAAVQTKTGGSHE